MTDRTGLDKLREPFPAASISKLPRITCSDCSRAQGRTCAKHQKSKCRECNNWITSAHMHMDYVGHAALTQRLLDADQAWTWEPVAFDDHGLPAFDRHGGLWIRLTVAGQTRLGYGDAGEKTGPNAVKEAIGDALRNAGMRFGAALDLWHKGDLPLTQTEEPAPTPEQPVDAGDVGVDLAAIDRFIATFKHDVAKASSVQFLNSVLWPQLKTENDSGRINSRQYKDLINAMGARKKALEAEQPEPQEQTEEASA